MNEKKEPLLSVENISISFGGLKALNGVSFNVYPGEIVAIIGPNGAGKTTMLNVINGVYTPDEGRIIFEGKERPLKNEPPPCGRHGHFQDLSEPGPVQGHDHPGKHHGGPDPEDEIANIFSQCVYWGMSEKEEIEHREAVEWIVDFL